MPEDNCILLSNLCERLDKYKTLCQSFPLNLLSHSVHIFKAFEQSDTTPNLVFREVIYSSLYKLLELPLLLLLIFLKFTLCISKSFCLLYFVLFVPFCLAFYALLQNDGFFPSINLRNQGNLFIQLYPPMYSFFSFSLPCKTPLCIFQDFWPPYVLFHHFLFSIYLSLTDPLLNIY